MIGFDPTEEQALMQREVAAFARDVLRPRQREFEAARALPDDVLKTGHAMGLGAIGIPERFGGGGLGMVTAVVLEEEIAAGDPAAAFALGGPGPFGRALIELGTDELAARHLARFTGEGAHDRFGAVAAGEGHEGGAVAKRDGADFVIDGEKAFVMNADRAEAFAVFARVDDAVSAFVVERATPGLRVLPRSESLGLDAVGFGGIALDGVRVTEDARLARCDLAGLVRFFAKEGLLVAARATGLARAAFEITRDYAETRRAFGKPIGHFQAVAFTLADRAMDVEAARGLVWRAAAAWDAGASERDALLATAHAITTASEAAMRAGDCAVQLHGGSGFMRDYPVEKLMRDAKQIQLCAMTASHATQLAAAIELGRAIDPSLVLPGPDSGNVFV